MKILVISPTYNEKKNISKLIEKIFSLNIPLDLLIIDDNSPDGTAEVVKSEMEGNSNIKIIQRDKKRGLSTAYFTGFNYAIENNYDIVIQIDADLSHNPEDIKKLLKSLESSDVVIGSRYFNGVNVINWPMSRLLLSYYANWYARVLTRVPIMDLTGGFKCFRIEVLRAINFQNIKSEGYSFQIEMNFLSYNKGFKIIEVPIIFTDRTIGESKMSKRIIFEAIFIVPLLFFKKLFRKF